MHSNKNQMGAYKKHKPQKNPNDIRPKTLEGNRDQSQPMQNKQKQRRIH